MKIGAKEPFLNFTACMSAEERAIIGAIDAYARFTGDQSFNAFRDPVAILGRSKWGRTELTDLGLLIAETDIEDVDASAE